MRPPPLRPAWEMNALNRQWMAQTFQHGNPYTLNIQRPVAPVLYWVPVRYQPVATVVNQPQNGLLQYAQNWQSSQPPLGDDQLSWKTATESSRPNKVTLVKAPERREWKHRVEDWQQIPKRASVSESWDVSVHGDSNEVQNPLYEYHRQLPDCVEDVPVSKDLVDDVRKNH